MCNKMTNKYEEEEAKHIVEEDLEDALVYIETLLGAWEGCDPTAIETVGYKGSIVFVEKMKKKYCFDDA